MDESLKVTIWKFRKLCELKEGHGFGEVALMQECVRTASITCTEESDFVTISKGDYKKIM